MSQFRPYGLFYDALSGEFKPPTDPRRRTHTLARLATAVCEKGVPTQLDGDMVYYPSWANQSYAEVSQPPGGRPFDTQVLIAEAYGRWPTQIRFTHAIGNRAMGSGGNSLIISGRHFEIIRPLALGPELDAIRQEVTEIARDFYGSLKPND